jgi:hypothetical protein
VSSFPPIPKRFRLIDETNWDEYHYIEPGDDCLYLWERMSQVKAGQWHQYPTNGFIANLQIPVSCKVDNAYRYKHKINAVKYAATALGQVLARNLATFVPMPPSKTRNDPEHDDRLLKVLKGVTPPLPDIRELVLLTENFDAKQKGISPEDRASKYRINEKVAKSKPSKIFIFDDVLTTGCHFKAVKMVLKERFPEAHVCGIFLARAVRPPGEDC